MTTSSTAEAGAEPTDRSDPSPDYVLTWRLQAVLQAIGDFGQRHGYAPTLREIDKAAGMASPFGVPYQLAVLQRTGYLRRGAKRPRTAEVCPGSSRETDTVPTAGPRGFHDQRNDHRQRSGGGAPTTEAEDSDIVAVTFEREATVETCRRSPDQVRLMPHNPHTHPFQLTTPQFSER
jgi:SOS-response transcriptional repressor LexA